MIFRSKETVEAIQFQYSEYGIRQLEEFCSGRVTRHGKQHLPTEGPWCYILLESSKIPAVLLEGEWYVKVKSSNTFIVIPDKDFKEQYEEI
jgi:hypothetical protein